MTSLPSALHLLMFPLLSAALLLSPSLCLHVCCLFCLQVNFNLCLLLESSLDVRVGGFFLQAALAKCTCSAGFTSLSLIGLNNLSRMLSLALMLWRTTLLPSITLWQYVTFFPCDFFFHLVIPVHYPQALESLDIFPSPGFVIIFVLLYGGEFSKHSHQNLSLIHWLLTNQILNDICVHFQLVMPAVIHNKESVI